MNNKNILETLNKDLCCGCGICKVSCPVQAISMVMTEFVEYRSFLDEALCVHCGRCLSVCPFSINAMQEKLQLCGTLNSYGLKESCAFQGIDKSLKRNMSSSGGVLSALLCRMLEKGDIQAVVHAEKKYANGENPPYFMSKISKSVEEINDNRSSFYYPIEFSQSILDILSDDKVSECCVVAVPCVIYSLNQLKKIDDCANRKLKYLFSLICSHNVNGQFSLNVAEDLGVIGTMSVIQFRNKEGVEDVSDYNLYSRTDKGLENRIPRHKTSYSENWRTYSFSLNSCLYCSDFFGVAADAGFKDAWGMPPIFSERGETLVVCNNEKLKALLVSNDASFQMEKIEISDLTTSQYETLHFKNIMSPYRVRKLVKNIHGFNRVPKIVIFIHFLEFKIKKYCLKRSKFLHLNHKKFKSRRYRFLLDRLAKARVKLSKLLSSRSYKSRSYNVIYTAGFGYDNVGDEAQLYSNLMNWERLKPGCRITILSPNPDVTRKIHGNYDVLYAPRKTLWSAFNLEYFSIGEKKIYFPLFLVKYFWVWFNAATYKYTGICFMAPTSAYLLHKIKTSDVLHIGGGGFLTGKTASRLYDNLALLDLACFFGTDVILSGHNIGVWQNWIQRTFAKKLDKAKFIGLRDGERSVRDLGMVGIKNSDKVKVLFDDALFCPAARVDRLDRQLSKYGMKSSNYIALHVHYWKVDKAKVNSSLNILAKELDARYEMTFMPYLMIPMTASDLEAMIYLKSRMKSKVQLFKKLHDIELVVAAYQNSHFCITMKHHPIIFSMAGCVPTLSLSFEDYYHHKNEGAMALFQQESYALRDDALTSGLFNQRLGEIYKDRNVISNTIRTNLNLYKKSNGLIIREYLKDFSR